ncbi:MAG: histidine phosphatase family protein [Anaerolineae bacterium]
MRLKSNRLMVAGMVFCVASFFVEASAHQKFAELKEDLGLSAVQQPAAKENDCHLYLVHHGDTEYTVEERLQGWIDIPLNDVGKQQMAELAQQLSSFNIDVIYSSSLIRAVESAAILEKELKCPVVIESALRGESHGNLEGLRKDEYEKDPHFIEYISLPSEDQIFFSVGEGGLSKADVARKAIPAIKEICSKHPGQNVVIVTHGGVLKFINFLLGNYTPEEINEVPHGDMLHIDGDGVRLVLLPYQESTEF